MSKRQLLALFSCAVVGWALCGATMTVGRSVASLETALVAHAIAAPLIFGMLAAWYFRSFPGASAGFTALIWVSFVILMDVLVVATFVERSFAMFASPLGTWIPFALIFSSTFVVGRMSAGNRRPLSHA